MLEIKTKQNMRAKNDIVSGTRTRTRVERGELDCTNLIDCSASMTRLRRRLIDC